MTEKEKLIEDVFNSAQGFISKDVVEIKPPKYSLAIPCLVCGDGVELDEYEEQRMMAGLSFNPKICDDCKKAILWAKERAVENAKI